VRILVIGATGLIGSAVCARLAADGHRVVGASRHRPPVDPAGVKHTNCAPYCLACAVNPTQEFFSANSNEPWVIYDFHEFSQPCFRRHR
jgi:nucleoside-diphosphate-sugar epimerase